MNQSRRKLAVRPVNHARPANAGTIHIELVLRPVDPTCPASAGISIIEIRAGRMPSSPFLRSRPERSALHHSPLAICGSYHTRAVSETALPLPRAPPTSSQTRKQTPAEFPDLHNFAWLPAREPRRVCRAGITRAVTRINMEAMMMNLRGVDTPQGRGSRRCRSAR